MGFKHRILNAFEEANTRHLAEHHRMSDGLNTLSVIAKVFRMMLQSGLLGVGAYLVIKGEMSGGAIIAASIASGRALAPIDTVIAHWKSFSAARQAIPRLDEALSLVPEVTQPLQLPKPKSTLILENLGVLIPGTSKIVLSDVNLELKSGNIVAVIGPSAAGKSSLARAITGVWAAARGSVLLDNAALERWSQDDIGNHIGYLPQDVELFDGTIAENIARFDPSVDGARVLAAAEAANVHHLILGLPEGYETRIGTGGAALSAGQRQRIGLARALYGEPFLIVLDEPNSNLDADGDAALSAALQGIRRRGGIAVVISHRTSIMSAVDTVVIMSDGRISKWGPRDEVLRPAIHTQLKRTA